MGLSLELPNTLAQAAGVFAIAAAASVYAHDLTAVQEPVDAPSSAVCPDGIVSRIAIDNRPVFDTESLPEGSVLRPIYSFANVLHVTTRPGFIRRELLFSEGDCLDALLLSESGRILRSYGFFDDASLSSESLGEGHHLVTVFTRDQWTTKFDLGVAFDQGLQLERLQLTEENLFGRGMLALVFMRRRRERRDLGFQVSEPRLLGTRADATLRWGRSRVGGLFDQEITYPFVSETGRWSFRQAISGRDEAFAFSTGMTSGTTHVLVPLRIEGGELSFATRIGSPGALTTIAMGASHDYITHSTFEGGVEVVSDGDFDSAVPAPDSIRSLVFAKIEPYAVSRVNLMFSQRNLRFERVRGLDALRGEQDIAVGLDLGLTLGWAIGAWPASMPGLADTFYRFFLGSGWKLGASYVFFNTAWQGNRVNDDRPVTGEEGGPETLDLLGEVGMIAYVRSSALSNSTLVFRGSASGGRTRNVPFQLTLGGRDGVRGLREEAFPGGKRLLFSVEDRIAFNWPSNYLDAGVTLFADAGRMWSGDVPFGTDSSWQTAVGFGLRFGFPAGTPRTARVDLAFPLGANGRSPVLRVSMRELLGVSRVSPDPQMERSRLSRVGPDRFVKLRN